MVLFASAAQSQGQSELSLTILTCPKAITLGTTPSATLYQGDFDRKIGLIQLDRASPELYIAHTNIEPGHYAIAVQDGFCRDQLIFTVLPDRQRSIGFVLADHGRAHHDAHAFLAGTLPMTGFSSASLVSGNGVQVPLILDNDAYYGEHLLDGTYTLVLYLPEQNLECRIPVTISGSGSIVNISAGEITKYIGYLLRYHGKPDGFELLYHKEIF